MRPYPPRRPLRSIAMTWQPFIDANGTRYELRHLAPALVTYQLPRTVMQRPRDVVVRVTYGMHCFTRDPKPEEEVNAGNVYFRNPEGRVFCVDRWTLTTDLPRIMDSFLERTCWETDRRNHVLFSSAQTADGKEYAVFFALRGASPGRDWDATLLVISAHARDGFKKRGKPQKGRELLRSML